MCRFEVFILGCVLLGVGAIQTASAQQKGATAASVAQVSAFAGNGRAGIVDGPRASAEFILPSALALDAAGNLYVADAAAQRIRVVRENGIVATLAGSGPVTDSGLWVDPGFRDGPAREAQFNRPSGIAVDRNGRVFVADTYNHCIRLISAGTVSTYAGTCGELGTKDGSRRDATFSYPRQLAVAPDETLYVADFLAGVRKIDKAGNVSTLPTDGEKRVTGISIERSGQIVIAAVSGLTFFDPRTNETKRVSSFYASQDFPAPVSGGAELGIPYAVAAEGNDKTAFFTDLRSDSVKFYSLGGFLTYLNGVPTEDAVTASEWQGAGRSALHGPMGIAFDRSGVLYVADSGHKRIVTFNRFGHDVSHGYTSPTALLKLQPSRTEYRILILGDSFAWFTDDERQSIGAYIEEKLRKDGALHAAGRVPRVITLYTADGFLGQPSLEREIIATSNVDFLMIFANSGDLQVFSPNPNAGSLFRDIEAQTVNGLKGSHIRSMFVMIPVPEETGPLEHLYQDQHLNVFTPDFGAIEQLLTSNLRNIGPPVLNLFPAVRSYEASAFIQPLYGNHDLHPSEYGRQFFADRIARELERRRPWEEKK